MEILDETRQYPALERLQRCVDLFVTQEGITQDITLILVDDATIHIMNRQDRDVDAPTDVLSYPLHDPEDASMPVVGHLGDVFISVDTAARQARQYQLSLEQEVLFLAAHGITHLRGYDHPTEEAWQTFNQAQKRMLDLLANQSA